MDIFFADDTAIYYIGDNVESVVDSLNRIASELYQWCIENKLTVNTDKTEAMLITAKPFVGPLRKLGFGNDNINFVNVSRSLGVYIDSSIEQMDRSILFIYANRFKDIETGF